VVKNKEAIFKAAKVITNPDPRRRFLYILKQPEPLFANKNMSEPFSFS
jgi:hypothetical protein